MPQEKNKRSLFCCEEWHRSGYYHKLKVHQQVTTVSFKDHPEADVTVNRNPETKAFHCPRCVKRYPLPSTLRDHMVFKCGGYAQFREPTLAKFKVMSSCQNDHQVVAVKDEMKENANILATNANTTQESERTGDHDGRASSASQSLLYPESQDSSQPEVPKSIGMAQDTMNPMLEFVSSTQTVSAHSVIADAEVVFLPPVLRPATWSPINTTTGIMEPRFLSYSPSLVSSAGSSSCSTHSLRTVADDDPTDSRSTLPVKTEKIESPTEVLDAPLPVRLPRQSDALPTAARVFLDNLRRPLGHAAPHLHGLGVVTEADLDLACTMPEAWAELGNLLRGSGVTMIEWLMVKEALKARAKRIAVAT